MAVQRFRLSVSVNDATGEPFAAYLQVRDGEAAETREVVEGKAFADYSEAGELLGIEFLAPCQVEVIDRLTDGEPDPVRRFLSGTMPRQLVAA